jgi:hypothetical protein
MTTMTAIETVTFIVAVASFLATVLIGLLLHVHRKSVNNRFSAIASALEKLVAQRSNDWTLLRNVEKLDQKTVEGFVYLGERLANFVGFFNDVEGRTRNLENVTGAPRPKIRLSTPAPSPAPEWLPLKGHVPPVNVPPLPEKKPR